MTQTEYEYRMRAARSRMVMVRGRIAVVEEQIASTLIEINDLKKAAYKEGLKVD